MLFSPHKPWPNGLSQLKNKVLMGWSNWYNGTGPFRHRNYSCSSGVWGTGIWCGCTTGKSIFGVFGACLDVFVGRPRGLCCQGGIVGFGEGWCFCHGWWVVSGWWRCRCVDSLVLHADLISPLELAGYTQGLRAYWYPMMSEDCGNGFGCSVFQGFLSRMATGLYVGLRAKWGDFEPHLYRHCLSVLVLLMLIISVGFDWSIYEIRWVDSKSALRLWDQYPSC